LICRSKDRHFGHFNAQKPSRIFAIGKYLEFPTESGSSEHLPQIPSEFAKTTSFEVIFAGLFA